MIPDFMNTRNHENEWVLHIEQSFHDSPLPPFPSDTRKFYSLFLFILMYYQKINIL